jgi:predicted DNA-binding transcriptional regulator YafY
VWSALLEGLRQQHTCVLTYGAVDNELRKRPLDPWGLLVRDGDWFVYGYSHFHAMNRTYAIPRIKRVDLTDQRFEVDTAFDFPTYVDAGFDGLTAEALQATAG